MKIVHFKIQLNKEKSESFKSEEYQRRNLLQRSKEKREVVTYFVVTLFEIIKIDKIFGLIFPTWKGEGRFVFPAHLHVPIYLRLNVVKLF